MGENRSEDQTPKLAEETPLTLASLFVLVSSHSEANPGSTLLPLSLADLVSGTPVWVQSLPHTHYVTFLGLDV